MYCWVIIVSLLWPTVAPSGNITECKNNTAADGDDEWIRMGCIMIQTKTLVNNDCNVVRDVTTNVTAVIGERFHTWVVTQQIVLQEYPSLIMELRIPKITLTVLVVNGIWLRCTIQKPYDAYMNMCADSFFIHMNYTISTMMLMVCTFPDEDSGSTVHPGERHVLTESKCIHLMYVHIINCTVQLYRSSTGSHVLLRQEANTTIGKDYVDRLLIEDGNVTLLNVSCADEGVYTMTVTPFNERYGQIYTYTIYAPHSCRRYTVMAVVGTLLVLLPFSTSSVSKGHGWHNVQRDIAGTRGVLHLNRPLTVDDDGEVFIYYDNSNIKRVRLNVTSSPLIVKRNCTLIRYRWKNDRGAVIPFGPFFLRRENTIAGFGPDYVCKPLKPRTYIVLGSVAGFCMLVLGIAISLCVCKCKGGGDKVQNVII